MAFDEIVWSEDLRNATAASRDAARRARLRLERHGQPIDQLLACATEGEDGTSLPGCVKTYVPQPLGPWGIVYLIARDRDDKLCLDHLAFGLRHPPTDRRASVYQLAHQRLNR